MQKSGERYELIDYRIEVVFRLPMSSSARGLRLSGIHACAMQRYKRVGPPKASQVFLYVQSVGRREAWICTSR